LTLSRAVRCLCLASSLAGRGFVVRQLRRCEELWLRVGGPSRHHPRWRDLRGRLASAVPPQTGLSIVHGGYRLSNLLVAGGTVTGVLDWELAAIADPMADVAWLLDDWRDPADPAIVMPSPTRADGFGTRADLISRYELASGRRLSGLAAGWSSQHDVSICQRVSSRPMSSFMISVVPP